MVQILTMHSQVKLSGGKPCPECGSRTAERSQRVTASDLDERHQWWLTRHSCEGCGWAQDELTQGASRTDSTARGSGGSRPQLPDGQRAACVGAADSGRAPCADSGHVARKGES
jgi:hypothetical protein